MENGNVKKIILCVDDDEIFLDMVRNILEKEYLIDTVNSGKKALEYLSKNIFPDLILLDIIMPDMDGWKTIDKIHSLSIVKDIPIIFVTSDTTGKEKAKTMGGADYITKPINGEDLVKRIKIVFNVFEKWNIKNKKLSK